ncbi:hypothetical protein EBU71_00125 [bacterium]|nr:hypothetical protein [Candidatus Elulimicrobium humile]
MILIDYSQVAISNILSFKPDLVKGGDANSVKNIIRHAVISTLKFYKKKYADYGELVVCADGKDYWRKRVFPLYKAHRKQAREDSGLDWKLIFDTMSEIRKDLVEYFPYKVMHLDNTEADDVIATLVKSYPLEKHIIISSDKDFKQLQKHGNVEQFSPIQKKKVTLRYDELDNFIIEHIVRGDSGDGIPNILSPDDIFTQPDARQRPITKKRLTPFFSKGINACENDEQRRNWERNEALVNLDKIPEDITKNIMEVYLNNKPKGDKMSIYTYLMNNRCNLLLQEIEEF